VPFDQRLARMIDDIRRLRREDNVDHETDWYSLRRATVRPGPAQADGPPIWIGATTDRAIKRAGRIGDAFMASPNADKH